MAKKKSAKAGAKKPAAKAVGKKSAATSVSKKTAAKKTAMKLVAKKPAPKAKSAVKPKAKPAAKSSSKSAAKASGKVSALKSAGKKVGKVAKKVVKALKPVANNVVPFARPSKSSATSKKDAAGELASIFSPLDDRVIVEVEGAATRTAGGLYIPDTVEATDRPQQGRVLAVGRGHRDKKGRLRPLDVQLGDMVLFERFLGSELNIGDRKLFVLRESQVLGIVKS